MATIFTINKNNVYAQLKAKIKQIKTFQVLTTFFLAFYTVSLYTLIVWIQSFVDALSKNHESNFSLEQLLLFMIFLIVLSVTGFISQYFFNQIPVRAKNLFLKEMFNEVLTQPVTYWNTHSLANIFSLFQNDCVSFAQIVSVNPVIFIYQSFTLLICIGLMFYTQGVLALILIVFVLVCFGITGLLSRCISQENQKVFRCKETLSHILMEGLENHRVILTLCKQNLFVNRLNIFLKDKLQKREEKAALYQSQYMTIYIILTLVLPFLSLVLGLYFVSLQWMSIGQALSMYALSSQLQEPIRQVAQVRMNRLTAIELSKRITVLLRKPSTSNKEIDTITSFTKRDVSFSYEDKKVLHNFNLTIKPGKHLLVKGKSGSGKSTLLSLMMRYLDGSKGTICANGIDIGKIKEESYYQHILMVDQKPLIFHDTLINNITLEDEYSLEEIHEVISVCQLEELAAEKKEEIIDSGSISGGQAQRISIARMLLRKPSILLMDEPTSALDEDTGTNLALALDQYAKKYGITYVVVSHKKDIMSICENVIELE